MTCRTGSREQLGRVAARWAARRDAPCDRVRATPAISRRAGQVPTDDGLSQGSGVRADIGGVLASGSG